MLHLIHLNGQSAYYHDEGDQSGYFHTYDGLQLNNFQDRPRKIHVFLPRCYDHSVNHYPVVYLNDGNTTFWPGGLSPYSWDVANTLGELYQNGKIRPLIIVAVHPLNRNYEYLHVKEFSSPFTKEGGGLADYSDYLVRLKDFIDNTYKTINNPASTTILGSSHGGLAAFYTGCVHREHFGNIGAFSPSFWVGGVYNLRATPLMAQVRNYLCANNLNRPRIWIDWGMKRSGGLHNFLIEHLATRWGKEMVKLLQKDYCYVLNKNLFQHEDKIGGHDERAWAYRFGLMMQKFYPC